ncbi:hypothetical protein JMJ35_010250 [Cladonia borealis]|uniref:Uncharacterized protein n=1 Tax=Cladonia borealis TaxID=184061 RepID=A0AA39QQC7_9LECA|nr:hypothetical protein JMJ35_010250 [Cladonia borealis]
MSFTTIATTPSVFTDWELSNTMSYDIVNPRIEVRLICLRSSRQEDGHTAWQVTNSPGTRMTDLQYPRRGGVILEMSPQVDELVNCLTKFLNDEQFQAKVDPRTTADNVTQWTEWHLAEISRMSDDPFYSYTICATVRAIIVREQINVPKGHSEAQHQRRSRSADDVRRRR